jgi:hypothetical protein
MSARGFVDAHLPADCRECDGRRAEPQSCGDSDEFAS